jgi:hypothetical protein
LAALATIASAVLFAQIRNPEGMLAAASRSEYNALAEARKGGPQRSDGATLDDLLAARGTAFHSHPQAAAHSALARLLALLVEADAGRQDLGQAATDAQQDAAEDPDNLIARLAEATIADMAGTEQADRGARALTAAERFDAIRAIVDAQTPARQATLYNGELTMAWYDVVKRFIKRPDVAITTAATLPHYEITDQYAALPMIQQRLASLADDLRKAGQTDSADRCIRWIARLSLGLIEADPDAGTRLLCADLLARSLDEQSPVARSLRKFQNDFTSAAAASPIDICDQAWSPTPAVVPTAYKWAFYSLVFASALGLVALGGAILFALSCFAAAAAAIIRRGKPMEDSLAKQRPIHIRLIGAALPPLVMASWLIAYLNGYGIHSQLWGLIAGICAVFTGALLAVALSNLYETSDRTTVRRRVAVVIALAVLGLLLAVFPPPVVTRACRHIEFAVGLRYVLLPGLLGMMIAAIVVSPARFRAIVSTAALIWCLNACIALAALQIHHLADAHYQRAVVAAKLDEVPARLGADWKAKYIKPALDAYDITKP